MNARDAVEELAQVICTVDGPATIGGRDLAAGILAAGYSKPRTITTPAEANALPDRSAFLTPGGIIFRKWKDYYGPGKDAWERELGQTVPAELLSEEGHFPATVLHEGATK